MLPVFHALVHLLRECRIMSKISCRHEYERERREDGSVEAMFVRLT